MKPEQLHKRKYWKASEKLTHCKACGDKLLPHKIYFCTSACSDRFRAKSKKIVKDYKAEVARMI